MITAAGITLREAIEAILVIFIMVAYLERTGEAWRERFVYGGAVIAVVLSIAMAVVLLLIGVNPENELIEGILFFLAAILVASLVVWMWQKAKSIKQEIETKIEKAKSNFALASIAFFMVFREGVETVIFLQSLLLTGTRQVQSFAGGLFGIGLAVIFGMVFLKGTTKINLSRFFKVTSAILAILVVKLIANGFHELLEIELLSANEKVLAIVGFFAKESTGAAIIALMLLVLMLMIIYDIAKAPEPVLSSLEPVERRKIRYELAKEKYFKIGLGLIILLLTGVVLGPAIRASNVTVPEPVAVQAENGLIKVAVPEDKEGFYRFRYGDSRFLVVVKNRKVRAALDRCYICPPKGYGFSGDFVICLNCDAPIEVETVGNPGGCNPKVVKKFVYANGSVNIDANELLDVWSGRSGNP